MDRRSFFKRVAIVGTAAVVAPTLLCNVKFLDKDVWGFYSFKYHGYTFHKRKDDIMDSVPYNFDERYPFAGYIILNKKQY